MKPFRIFFLFLSLLVFFCLLSFLTPEKDITLTKDLLIRIPQLTNLIEEATKYASIAPILQMEAKPDIPVATTKTKEGAHKPVVLAAGEMVQALEYPGNDKAALLDFYKSLSEIRELKKGCHILHFGDSQLEGDRVSDYLRVRFQQEFGGSGPGLMGIDDAYRSSIQTVASDNWVSYSSLRIPQSKLKKKIFGPLGAVFRFKRYSFDTLEPFHNVNSRLTFSQNKKQLENPIKNVNLRIFYANNLRPLTLEIKNKDQVFLSDTLGRTALPAEFSFSFSQLPPSLTLQFSGSGSPDFYGISIDNPEGIAIDNIAMRGSSGLEFTKMDRNILQLIFNSLNVKLLVLEFGVNVLSTYGNNYNYYQKGLYNQLMFLKSLKPDLSILVIGVSDASVKRGGDYHSYPNIENVVEAQRSAAMNAGCAFWNLYSAMGGANSMPSWVFANPPLATTDFIHFNYTGARMVGKMLWAALINDYNEYLKNK